MPSRRSSSYEHGPATVGTTRVGSVSALPQVLQKLGCPLEPVLKSVGLPPDLFDDNDRLIDIEQSFRLLNVAAERAACPHVGLLCGALHRPETIGLAGRMARNARDVGSALRGLALNLHLNGHVFVPTLVTTGDTAEFVLQLVADISEPPRVGVDLGFAGAFSIVRAICGPDWSPLDVLLVHAPAGDRKPYDRFYGPRLRFGCDRNAVVFSKSWLNRPVHGANPAELAALEQELALIAHRTSLPLPAATRRALLACIARGDLSTRAVAAALGLQIRTLNRRLAADGTSVFQLTKEVRYKVARDLLANTALPVTEIAATLVYANTGGFTRAFTHWSGSGPGEWRRHQRTEAVSPPKRSSGRLAGQVTDGKTNAPSRRHLGDRSGHRTSF